MSEATRIGAVLAGYRVESLLGRGGMSVVYLAEHVSLGRKVALKVLASPLAHDPSFRERFMRESQRAAGLDHPNVIPIYDAGEVDGGDADGLLYIAMRYVDGPDLRSLLRREGHLGVGRTLYMLEQVASALDAAHDNDLIHRDVKPSNILIAEPSEHVYLTDFGVAKQTSGARPHADRDLRRHHRVRRARADRGADARPSHRRLRARLRALRVPRRPAAVRAGRRGRGDARPPDEPAAAADGGAPRPAQGARQGRRARDGEVAGRALRDRAGAGGRRPWGSATQSDCVPPGRRALRGARCGDLRRRLRRGRRCPSRRLHRPRPSPAASQVESAVARADGVACGVGAAARHAQRTSNAEHAAVGPDRDPRRARRDRLGDCGVSRRPRRRRERGRVHRP